MRKTFSYLAADFRVKRRFLYVIHYSLHSYLTAYPIQPPLTAPSTNLITTSFTTRKPPSISPSNFILLYRFPKLRIFSPAFLRFTSNLTKSKITFLHHRSISSFFCCFSWLVIVNLSKKKNQLTSPKRRTTLRNFFLTFFLWVGLLNFGFFLTCSLASFVPSP